MSKIYRTKINAFNNLIYTICYRCVETFRFKFNKFYNGTFYVFD